MNHRIVFLLISSASFLFFINFPAFAADNAKDTIESTKNYLSAEAVAKKEEEDENSIKKLICNNISIPLICPAVDVHNLYAPETGTIRETTEDSQKQIEELQQINDELTALSEGLESGEIAGTSSAQVLGITDLFESIKDKITNIFSKDKPIAGHVYPAGKKLKETDPEKIIQGDIAGGMLLAQAKKNPTDSKLPDDSFSDDGSDSSDSTPGFRAPPGATQPTQSIRTLAKEAGDAFGVPWQVIEAIIQIEGDHVFELTPDQAVLYQQPGEKVPTNCEPNACSAAGPVQFTTGIDDTGSPMCAACGLTKCPATWNSYRNAVLEVEDDGRIPNVCNLKDSIYGMAKMLKVSSGTPKEKTDWTISDVTFAARAYYGSCTSCDVARPGTGAKFACDRLGKTYCDYVWDYYSYLHDDEGIIADPPVDQSGIYNKAISIVDRIGESCSSGGVRGVVTSENRGCLTAAQPPFSIKAVAIWQSSARDYDALQCVGLPYGAKLEIQNEEVQAVGNAIDYARTVPQGYRFVLAGSGAMPRSGDLLIWDIGIYGHLAYIARVFDANQVEVIEANWGVSGKVQARIVTLNTQGVYGWITPQ